jgi:hypothetical protein
MIRRLLFNLALAGCVTAIASISCAALAQTTYPSDSTQQLAQPQLEHVWGRISAINKSGFEIAQNFNADPQSGYRRGRRQITFTAKTKFEESARQDLRVGRSVDVIGRETAGSGIQATRVIIYEGSAPVRMPAGVRVIAPDGSVHATK